MLHFSASYAGIEVKGDQYHLDSIRSSNLQVRHLAELRTIGWPYHQRGLVATVRTETPNEVAHQRFLETGPLALLPVRDGFSNIVWSTTPNHAKELEACSPANLAARVNEVSLPHQYCS